jgi:HPt (histidine-containing phosphotransfer) domain-containing protein
MSIQPETTVSACHGLPVLDTHETLENIGFDTELYRSIVEMYLEQCIDLPDELIDLLDGNDLSAIERSAHTLKGVVANIGSRRFMELMQGIQEMARTGTKPESSVYASQIKEEARLLKDALEKIDWTELERFCEESNG